jgi:hypothetical protein
METTGCLSRPEVEPRFQRLFQWGPEFLGLRPISVNLRGRDQDRKARRLENPVPQAPKAFGARDPMKVAQYEVLGSQFFKRRPSRRDDRWSLVLLKPPPDQGAECFDRPLRDGHLFFASFPSTSYWATFTKSLRDEYSAHTLSLKLTLMGLSPGYFGGRLRH